MKIQRESPEMYKGLVKQVEESFGSFIGEKGLTPTNLQKFVEYATMVKLTGVSTHVRSTIGNASLAVLRVPEKFVAGVLDTFMYGARKVMQKTGLKETALRDVYATEALPETLGMLSSIPKAFSAFGKMLVSPTKYLEEATKASEAIATGGAIGRGGRLVSPLDKIVQKASGGRFGVNAGEIVRSPGRIIGAVDAFFKEIHQGADIYAQATRMGLKEGKRGADLVKHIAKVVKNPTEEMLDLAKLSGRERVFQQDLPGLFKRIDSIRKEYPALRLFMPFFTTPINLLKQAVQRSPAALALPTTWKTVNLAGNVTRMEYVSRMFVGSAILGGMYQSALEGRITSLGSKSKSKRDTMRLTGWQPQSVQLTNGDWVSYRGFEPLSSWFRAAADWAESENELTADRLQKVFASFGKQFAENPFFMGVQDIVDILNDPEAEAPKLMSSLAVGSIVPNILQQWATRIYDPVVREPKTTIERLKSRTPVLTKEVKPMRTIFGEQIIRDLPEYSMLGFNVSVKKGGFLESELARLEIGIGKPSRDINGIELNDEEYERMFMLKGTMLKQVLTKVVNSEGYRNMEERAGLEKADIYRKKVISGVVRKINAFAKAQVYQKYFTDRIIEQE